jgi:uncharacterized protein YbjT (DUF2867 family)
MGRTLLVTGATGTVSRALRATLRDSEFDIRAMVRTETTATPLRDLGVQAVVGDLDDPRSLPPAFEGVHDLWLLVPNGPRAPEHSMNAVWAARQAGVERVVRLSAVGAAHDAPTRSGRLHALSDGELRKSGLGWTILRPHWFMQNLLNDAAAIASHGAFSMNAGDARLGMIDVRDLATFAARILDDGPDRHDGRIYTPTGPRPISFADVARRLTAILGRPVEYAPVTDETHRRTLLRHGVDDWLADMLVEYGRAYTGGWGDFTTNDFADVVGRAPRDVDDFIRDHQGAFI